jgi:broad-specificity NMP kinase
MHGAGMSKGLLLIGNVIRNVAEGKDDFLKVNPDIESSGKITKLMSSFTYTPNIVIDSNLKYMDESHLRDLVKTELLAFSGILLQAFRVLSEVYSDRPSVIVNKMANHGKVQYSDLIHGQGLYNAANESVDYTYDLFEGEGVLPLSAGNEASWQGDEKPTTITNNSAMTKDANIFVTTYEVQISVSTENGDTRIIVLPVVVYPNIIYTDAASLINNMVETNKGKTLFERIDDYRAGMISLSDLVFATDLVKKYKDKKIKNENDFAKYLNRVDKVSSMKDLFYGHNSFHKNFNIYIFDIANKQAIEKELRGSVYIEKYKNKLTDTLAAFSVTLVDTEAEEVVVLMDSIPGFSTLNFNMLKKDKETKIEDVMKELVKNKQPF